MLISIWDGAAKQSLSFLPPKCLEQMKPYVEDHIKFFKTFVYPVKGEPYGFITFDENRILHLYVAPDRQGQGIGEALLNHAKSLHETLSLEVHEKNQRAIGFYERNGFIHDGRMTLDSCGEAQEIMLWNR